MPCTYIWHEKKTVSTYVGRCSLFIFAIQKFHGHCFRFLSISCCGGGSNSKNIKMDKFCVWVFYHSHIQATCLWALQRVCVCRRDLYDLLLLLRLYRKINEQMFTYYVNQNLCHNRFKFYLCWEKEDEVMAVIIGDSIQTIGNFKISSCCNCNNKPFNTRSKKHW